MKWRLTYSTVIRGALLRSKPLGEKGRKQNWEEGYSSKKALFTSLFTFQVVLHTGKGPGLYTPALIIG